MVKRRDVVVTAMYRGIFKAAPDAIVIVDGQGRIRDLNPQAERLFEYSREELLGVEVEQLVPESLRGRHQVERDQYMKAPRLRPMGVGLELWGRRKDGTEVPVEISLSPMPADDEECVVAIVRDMTERNRLRRFGTEAVQAAEEERLRIARELHDDAAQRLAALLMQLRVARGIEDAERREILLDGFHDELLETAEAIRRIAHGLRPPELEEVGLEAAVRALARSVRESHGLEIVVESRLDEGRLLPDAELAFYRIVQEALSNVVRHAHATCVRVSLSSESQTLTGVVEDDGRCFDPERASDARGSGLGLIGMRERAEHLGGEVRIASAPGEGTRVHVELPLDETSAPSSVRPSREQART